jgi:hypothetical protein
MDAAAWGLIGTVIGGMITIIGNLFTRRMDRESQANKDRVQRVQLARDQRKLAYLRLLTAARKLRYESRPAAQRDPIDVDSLRTELSTVNYEIELVASAEVAAKADLVRRTVLDYLNAAIKNPVQKAADGTSTPSKAVEEARKQARLAVDQFIKVSRADLSIDS